MACHGFAGITGNQELKRRLGFSTSGLPTSKNLEAQANSRARYSLISCSVMKIGYLDYLSDATASPLGSTLCSREIFNPIRFPVPATIRRKRLFAVERSRCNVCKHEVKVNHFAVTT